MANTPFIQFPCGEWAPGFGPEDDPCDPLVDGDCDDDDIRHPIAPWSPDGPPPGTSEGWHCITGGGDTMSYCVFGPGAGYATYAACMADCGDDPPPSPPPVFPPSPPGIIVTPPHPGPGGPGGGGGTKVYIELCPCETEGEEEGGCIKQVGPELVQKWVAIKEDGCATVILEGVEGQAGGGCETSVNDQMELCEVCPCWEIGEPMEGSVDCVEPDQGDGSTSGIIAGVTNNINAGTHCPEDLKFRCCPKDCEEECEPTFILGHMGCPGCKPFNTDAGGGDDGGEDGECVCELKATSQGYKYKIVSEESEAVECPEGGTGGPVTSDPGFGPGSDEECECCEVKIEVEMPQVCRHAEEAQEGEDAGAAAGAAWVASMIHLLRPCPQCMQHAPPEEVECPIDEESGWKVRPGGDCDCDELPDPDASGGGDAVPTPGGGGGGGTSPGQTISGGGGPNVGMDICDPAVWQICWKEKWCHDAPPGPGPAPGVITPISGGPGGDPDKCVCVPKFQPPAPGTGDTKCPEGCCEDGCSEGEECKGQSTTLKWTWQCKKQGAAEVGDEFCGCTMPQESCTCPKRAMRPGLAGTTGEDCPGGGAVQSLVCYKGCKCKGGDGDNVDPLGPCDDKASPAGSTSTNGSSGNSSGGNSGGQGGNGGGGGGTGNHEVGGDTSEWAGKGRVEYFAGSTDESYATKGGNDNRNTNIPYSRASNSEFQVNAKLNQQANDVSRRAYGEDFKFNLKKGAVTRKNRDVISRDIEIRSENFLAATKNARFTETTKTPRGSRTSNTLYNDNLTLFGDAPVPKQTSYVINSYNLDIFAGLVLMPVYSHLHSIAQEDASWDEAVVDALTLSNIRKSLNPRCLSIGKSLRLHPQYGLNHFDFYKIIREHLLRNTLNELDLSFYETFVSKQSKIPRFAVVESEDNEKVAVQMAISYARTAYPVDTTLGVTNQYSTLYRGKYSDLGSKIAIDRACGETFLKISSRDTIPITCASGAITPYSIGSDEATPENISLVGSGDCDNTIPITQEKSHAVRLNNKVRNKVLSLLGVDHSEEISAETNKSLEVELNYSLTDKLDEYYFFGADFSTTEQVDNFNDSDYLVQFNRDYRRVTDTNKIKDIMENQLGTTHYINHDDRLCNHFLQSNILKYKWVDFTLQGFGLEDVESFPVFVAKNPAYIIVIPSALSENNPYHVFSDLYISGDIVGRRVKMALHIDAQKLQTGMATNKDAVKVERDDT